jgi:CDP-glycerol glycerophosphotransferase (TagB/SpsB family)
MKLEVVKKLVDSELSASDDFLMYMPTFRCGEPGKSDNAHRKIHNIFGFSTIDTASLNAFLESNNLLLLLKLHPFEEEILKDSIEDYGNRVLMISNISLLRHSVDLYSLLASVTLLITDYSSVYFDYLLLNRPMGLHQLILWNTKRKEDFCWDHMIFWTPGPKATNQQQLQDEILKSLENPEFYRKERETINSIVNHYKDDHSCERVTQLIMQKLNRKK